MHEVLTETVLLYLKVQMCVFESLESGHYGYSRAEIMED